jgi:MoaA/NifB/PqqE/SkfB family radical SAM enzyme
LPGRRRAWKSTIMGPVARRTERNVMFRILASIPLYVLMRRFGWPRMLPLNLTASVTYRCNSRCRTCNVYEKHAEELSAEEFDRVFASLKKAPYWYTMSGGEPFLRPDLPDICESAYRHNSPGIINIPTNGLLVNRIPEMVNEIASRCPGSQIIVNLSLDEIGPRHDDLRGVEGNFDRAIETYRRLRELTPSNLTIGVHTVISVYNVERVPAIYTYVMDELGPDSFITEIAEQRVELGTVGADITPSPLEYGRAVDFLSAKIKGERFSGISRVTQSFRIRYYDLVKEFLSKNEQVLPCFAGVASAHIAPDGDVWFCCIVAEPVGNLRDVEYDFRKLWFGEKARAARERVRRRACACPLANASYTNMLMHAPTLAGVAGDVLVRSGRARAREAAPYGHDERRD